MEDAKSLEAQRRRTPRRNGTWNVWKVVAGTGEALAGPGPAVREQTVRITEPTGSRIEPAGRRRGSYYRLRERDNTTRPEGRTPASSVLELQEGVGAWPPGPTTPLTRLVTCNTSCTRRPSGRRIEGSTPCMTGSSAGTFSGGRGWRCVANQGAPGVDAVTIADIEASGVEGFLAAGAAGLDTQAGEGGTASPRRRRGW